MPFYLRKSISAGPFRFNLSKSGVGLSVGVRGLRIGTGPRGHFIHASASGFYYRASLGGGGRRPVSTTHPRPVPRHWNNNSVDMVEIESGDVLAMTDAEFKDLLDEINRKCAQVRFASLLGWASGGIAVGTGLALSNPIALLLVPPAYLLGRWLDSYLRATVLYYDLDDAVAVAYRQVVDAFEEMGRCARAWHVSASGSILDTTTWKRNAGATALINRSAITLTLHLPNVVKCNLDPPYLRAGKQEIYFFPDFALVFDGHRAGAISYPQLHVEVQQGQQIERDVANDAKVVGHTWQHPNKKGGPDRRFAYNRQIPVCLYDEVYLTSLAGLNERVVLSKLGTAEPFATAVRSLARFSQDQSGRERKHLPPLPVTPSREQLEDNARAAQRSSWMVGAVGVMLGVMLLAGLIWRHFGATDVAQTIPVTIQRKSLETIPTKAKEGTSTTVPAKELTTGSLSKGEGVSTGDIAKVTKPRDVQQEATIAEWMSVCKTKCNRTRAVAAKRQETFDWSQCYLVCLAGAGG